MTPCDIRPITGTMTVDVLVEASAHRPTMRGEHGLALLVTTTAGRLLFDAGQSALMLDNAAILGISMDGLTRVVLSHGHYDHGGGIPALAERNGPCTVFAHPAAFDRKLEKTGVGDRDIGLRWPDSNDIVRSTASSPRVLPGGFVTTGSIPRLNTHEQHLVGTDPLIDEQALIVPTTKGAVVLVGCAHAGLGNTLAAVRALVGPGPLRAVLGGFHLLHATDDDLAVEVARLSAEDVGLWGPCHCTGRRAQADMLRAMPGRVRCLATGDRLTFEEG